MNSSRCLLLSSAACLLVVATSESIACWNQYCISEGNVRRYCDRPQAYCLRPYWGSKVLCHMYKDVEDKQRTRELTEPDVYCPSSVYQDCKCGYTQEDLGKGLGNSEAFCDCQLSVYASAVESRTDSFHVKIYTVVVCVVLVMVTACFLKFFLKCLGDPLTTFFSSKLSFGLDKRASEQLGNAQ